jgi:hypothetical protein
MRSSPPLAKKSISLNIDFDLYKNIKKAAVDKETTFTNLVQHWIKEGMAACKHDTLK